MRPWLFCFALAACTAHSPPAPPLSHVELPVGTNAAPADSPSAAPAAVKSIVDETYPHDYDGKRPNAGSASLRAVSEHEAWLELRVSSGPSYDAIIDLEKGCVKETFDRDGRDALQKAISQGADLDLAAALASEPLRSRVGAHFARLARFPDIEIWAVMARGRSDGSFAMSADHRKLAVIARNAVYLSLDGGARWEAVSEPRRSPEDVRFVGDDRYLVYEAFVKNHARLETIDLDAPAPRPVAVTEIADFTALRAGLLFAHTTERCIHDFDPAAHALRKRACLPGPKTGPGRFFAVSLSPSATFVSEIQGDFQATRAFVTLLAEPSKPRALKGGFDLHNASVGPDDAGRFAWEGKPGVLRVDGGPEGMHEEKLVGAPLGFDRSGHALMFVAPTKGTLESSRCSLIARSR